MPEARTLSEKIWESHVVTREAGQARSSLHRPAPGARSDLGPGFRGLRMRAARCAGLT